jgi:hypothetical protein
MVKMSHMQPYSQLIRESNQDMEQADGIWSPGYGYQQVGLAWYQVVLPDEMQYPRL